MKRLIFLLLIAFLCMPIVFGAQYPKREDIKIEIVKIEHELDCLTVNMVGWNYPPCIYTLNNCPDDFFYLHPERGETELSDPVKRNNTKGEPILIGGDCIYLVPEDPGNWTLELFNKNDSSKNITIYGKTMAVEVKEKSIFLKIYVKIVKVILGVLYKISIWMLSMRG